LLDAYPADALDAPRRTALRSHLRSRGRCREAAVRTDPSLLFVAAPPGEPDPGRIEEVTRAVLMQVRQQRLQRRLGHRRPWLAAAAAVVLSLIGIAGWRLLAPGSALEPAAMGAQAAEAPSPPPRIEVTWRRRCVTSMPTSRTATAVTFIVNPSWAVGHGRRFSRWLCFSGWRLRRQRFAANSRPRSGCSRFATAR
jgi:hypothetical protein